MEQEELKLMNPYHYVSECIGGKWKMTLLRYLHGKGAVRFSCLQNTFGISEKVLSKQLRELTASGLIRRTQPDPGAPKVFYELSGIGESLAPLLEQLYQWGLCRMKEQGIPAAQEEREHGRGIPPA